tara:strand:- start:26 stop:451 length:426 start_codon:yes stop_codon:yes gene_type:complete
MSKCGNVKKVFVPSEAKDASETAIKKNISFTVTDTAIEKIRHFVQKDGKSLDTHGLKIRVVRDGCSGNSYDMALALISDSKSNKDHIFEFDGVNVMVEKLSYMFIIGSELDYVETLLMSGFQINNPNVKKQCSCGSSFSIK